MINPNEEKFTEGNMTKNENSNSSPLRPEGIMAAEESELDSPSGMAASSGDVWAEGRERLAQARDRTQLFLRENPVPAILGALGLGLAIGWALRHATADEEKEVEVQTPLGNLDWSFLSLPFLWPFFRSVKERAESSAESVKDGVTKLKKDIRPYTKPIEKRWKSWRH
jgi:hypothetical protein